MCIESSSIQGSLAKATAQKLSLCLKALQLHLIIKTNLRMRERERALKQLDHNQPCNVTNNHKITSSPSDRTLYLGNITKLHPSEFSSLRLTYKNIKNVHYDTKSAVATQTD